MIQNKINSNQKNKIQIWMIKKIKGGEIKE